MSDALPGVDAEVLPPSLIENDSFTKKLKKGGAKKSKKSRRKTSNGNGEVYDADFEEEDDDAGISGDNASHASVNDHTREWLTTSTTANSVGAPGGSVSGQQAQQSQLPEPKSKKGAKKSQSGNRSDAEPNAEMQNTFNMTIRSFGRAMKGANGTIGPGESASAKDFLGGGGQHGLASGDELPQVSPRTANLHSPLASARSQASGYESMPPLPALQSARGGRAGSTANAENGGGGPSPSNALLSRRPSDPSMPSHHGAHHHHHGHGLHGDANANPSVSLPSLPVRSRGTMGGFEALDASPLPGSEKRRSARGQSTASDL